jgi:hypothetical protein
MANQKTAAAALGQLTQTGHTCHLVTLPASDLKPARWSGCVDDDEGLTAVMCKDQPGWSRPAATLPASRHFLWALARILICSDPRDVQHQPWRIISSAT